MSAMLNFSRKFANSQEGAVLPFFGLIFLVIILVTGVAVDYSRAQMVQSKLQYSLDASGLAAAAVKNSRDTNTEVFKFMDANFPSGYMDAQYTSASLNGSTYVTSINKPDQGNGMLELRAAANVKTLFMHIFGYEEIPVEAYTAIDQSQNKSELVLVLDITGSMYGSKIRDLRTAARTLVDSLYKDPSLSQNQWVGIVPYVTTVNIGTGRSAWLRNYDLSRYPATYPAGATKWKGCVEARGQKNEPGNLDLTDIPPQSGVLNTQFPMFFWESYDDNKWLLSSGNVNLNENAGYENNSARGPNVGCGNEVTPLTTDVGMLRTRIGELTPWRRGGTMSSIGMAWGWRMISPRWKGMWGDPQLPHDADNLIQKTVVVMTDGINAVYTPNASKAFMGSDYTGYGYIEEENLGAGVNTRVEGVNSVNNKFATICRNMKAQDIRIFAITFQLGNSASENETRALFRNCATTPDHYFDSPDGNTLRAVFQQIADALANLRISR
ncbi:MAG: pilus assembly protein [Alphaproteobacteria bacterium]|nr:pilus assembly protein [Alphaproteobacteria bacterium]